MPEIAVFDPFATTKKTTPIPLDYNPTLGSPFTLLEVAPIQTFDWFGTSLKDHGMNGMNGDDAWIFSSLSVLCCDTLYQVQ